MKFLLALDSYKNCLDSGSVAEALAGGIREILPAAEIDILPVADGGEGSVRAVAGSLPEAVLKTEEVSGPLGHPHPAEYAWIPDTGTAFLELAGICGIELLPGNRKDIMHASTFGLGEMIRKLHSRGVRKFDVAIGGSASCDGGLGLLQALGAEFHDRDGRGIPAPAGPAELPRIDGCNLKTVLQTAADISLRIFSDVTNPLLGPRGAAAVFAPQKGARPDDIPVLEESLKHFHQILSREIPGLSCSCPGDGAAGGTGFALRGILGGQSVSGAEAILTLARFRERLAAADWVITGEGRSDSQTLQGKLPGVIAGYAEKMGIPAVLVSGAVQDDSLLLHAFTAVFSIARGPGLLQEAMDNTPGNLRTCGRNIAALIRAAGKSIS